MLYSELNLVFLQFLNNLSNKGRVPNLSISVILDHHRDVCVFLFFIYIDYENCIFVGAKQRPYLKDKFIYNPLKTLIKCETYKLTFDPFYSGPGLNQYYPTKIA